MQTKPLLYGIIGFLLGGLLVSVAALTFDKPSQQSGMTMQGMRTSLEGKSGDDFDRTFVSEMIEHHQGAIEMAKLSEKQAKHSEVKTLSKAIITAQEKEINEMRQWQEMWGYGSTSKNTP